MENASKALIIAGAILLSILLISLGIIIYNQASGVITGSGMTEAELSTFNAKFTKYEGDSVKGSIIKSMVQEVLANNKSENASDETRIEITGMVTLSTDGNSPTYASGFKTTKTYKVTCEYNDSGRIDKINVANN